MMRRVPEVAEINQPDKDTYDGYHFSEHFTKVIEFALQWSFLADLLGYRMMDMTNSGFLSNKSDYSTGASTDDGCTLIKVNWMSS